MAEFPQTINDISEILDTHLEWLIVRENGRTLPMLRSEIEVKNSNGLSKLGFVDENGLSVLSVDSFETDGADRHLV